MSKIKNIILKQTTFGTDFTSDPLLKSQIENSNIVYLAGTLFILVLSLSNYLDNQIVSCIKLLIEASILILNRIILKYTKKIKLYTSIIIFVISFIVCEAMISGQAIGAGIISIGVLITSVMYMSKYRFGFYLSICLLLFEVFIILFNSKIDWIYTYPEYMETYFIRFIGAHIGGFIISYFGLKKQKELYRNVNEEKELRNKLFVNIVHDLKTPLTIMRNSVDQCLYGENDEESKKLLKSNFNKMEHDILNILNLNRLEKGLIDKNKNEITNISILTRNICNSFKDYALSRSINITNKISNNLSINIDSTSYTEILNNLIENAIKYTEKKGDITITLRKSESMVLLSVEDTGIGISKDNIKEIFTPYYQGEKNYESYYGLGIGLSITKDLCETWGGSISVKSQIGIGSRFMIKFPSKVNKTEKLNNEVLINKTRELFTPEDLSTELPEYNRDNLTIMIVEDTTEIKNLLVRTFKENYNLIVANNGLEALEKYDDYSIDLIITDLMMPIMDGKEFIEKLIEKEGSLLVPVIVLTAKAGDENILEYLSIGVIDYISKPFSTDVLSRKVESILSVFKKKQDQFIESMSSNLIDYLKNNRNIKPTLEKGKKLNYENLRRYSITEKEQKIIQYIEEGLSYKEIAYEENISVNTVKTHIYRVYKKSSINNYSSLIELFYN